MESVTYHAGTGKRDGYWYKKDYSTGKIIHSTQSDGIATIDGAVSEELRQRAASCELDPVTDAEEIARRAKGYTGGNSFIVGRHGSKVTWSEPPHKIMIGEENKVKMDVAFTLSEIDEDCENNYGIKVRYSMEVMDCGSYPQPDRKDPTTDLEYFYLKCDGERSVKAKRLWEKDHSYKKPYDHLGFYELTICIDGVWDDGISRTDGITYQYKCVPKFKEVTTVASDDVGEDPVGGGTDQGGSTVGGSTGGGSSSGGGSHSGSLGHGGESTGGSTEIPWDFIVGGAVGVAVIGAGSRIIKNHGNSKKNPPKSGGKKSNNQEDNVEEKQEEQQPQSSFRMILYKDFGSTLMAGEWKQVGARIEEVTPQGQKIERLDLTRRIGIAAEEGCVADGTKQQGKYMMANVTVARNEDGSVADHAKVKLTFNGPRGVLVNHVLFNVIDQPEIVIPEALTFEAKGGKTQYIEFGINRYQGQVLGVKVAIEEAGLEFSRRNWSPTRRIR